MSVKKTATQKSVAAKTRVSSTKKAPPVKPVDQIVNQTEMAEILGVTPRWLRQMISEGLIETAGRARFPIGSTVQAYATFLREGATKKTGTESLDRLREEKALDIRLNRERKDRNLISMDEAIGVIDEVVGMFVASLTGLPAQITGVPRERQRLNEIFDTERQRLADRFAERRSALQAGSAAFDPASEDDAT